MAASGDGISKSDQLDSSPSSPSPASDCAFSSSQSSYMSNAPDPRPDIPSPLENGSMKHHVNGDSGVNGINGQMKATKVGSRSWVGIYESFLMKNASQIASVESTLQHLTYLFPAKFKDAEIASEVVYSALGILGLYHDTILARALSSCPSSAKYQPSLHTRYTRHFTTRNSAYRTIAYMLVVIQKTELLNEIMSRRHGGQRGQHTAILGIESIKATCRLALLRISGTRTLVTPPIPERDIDPNVLDQDGPITHAEAAEEDGDYWMMPRTGQKMPQLKGETDVTRFLMKKVLLPDDVAPSPKLIRPLTTADGRIKEILYILRPLVYALLALLAARLRASKRFKGHYEKVVINWMPWVVGFALEYVCRDGIIDSLSAEGGIRAALTKITGLEKRELEKRSNSMWWWTLRGQFYDSITKPILDKMIKKAENIPLLNLVGLYITDYQYLAETYHFSTSTL
ncbi:peroxisomal membrane protein-domain-containing protein [Lipomyces tetrasporus]|uniref:Peroxisomal membrane protein PEX16 n=1 Tax=Lipomyces tetrasporus TaxID=54092 RepID=A0AAD7VSV6_9ASCO|nr:peroxisomal membrane protein-domain-containing protein [Lipomyces tetrasporus]KAJ8099430.1 peroxisomal membrane protein-domain-containing protein [Lipomyces tetrasporus]